MRQTPRLHKAGVACLNVRGLTRRSFVCCVGAHHTDLVKQAVRRGCAAMSADVNRPTVKLCVYYVAAGALQQCLIVRAFGK